MSPVDSVTVIVRGSPARERQWYAALARLVAAAPLPAAVLVESASDRPHAQLTVRPPDLVDVLRRSLAGASVRLTDIPGHAPTPSPRLRAERTAYLVGTGRNRSIPLERERVVVDRIGIGGGTPPGSWLGLQTFWLPGGRGLLRVARRFRFAIDAKEAANRAFPAAGAAVAAEWVLRTGAPCTFRASGFGGRRDWRRGALRTIPPDGWFECPPETAAMSVLSLDSATLDRTNLPVETPAIVLGASGAGKTTYLARWAAAVVDEGGALFAIDLHGDLAPAILSRLSRGSENAVVAVDATRPPVPGIAALAFGDGSRDRAAAHLVAALKRLTPDGTDLYWGFRLERIFDTFVRLALESGGSLVDVYDLLTNPDRRDSCRLATRSGELARFLDELAPVVRRNPEFLWSAATRLSKVVLVPALRELLSPDDGGLPVERLLANGRCVLVRLPFATLGPEAAGFAATLVLGRVYLGVAAAAERRGRPVPIAVVLDEVQALPPRLVAEILTEGRKFGVRAIVATQYPDRLSRELESAARGALRGFVAFRVPRPAAPQVGAWLGLGPWEASELLPNLPTGEGLVGDSLTEGIRAARPEVVPSSPTGRPHWEEALEATRREFSVLPSASGESAVPDLATERLLLAVLSAEEAGATLRQEDVVAAAVGLPGSGPDPALLQERFVTLLRDGTLLEEADRGFRLTDAGGRRLGLTAPTGATRETAEHRALLMATFRCFARRGYRLEILRQGRFDTTLPDARFRQLPQGTAVSVPADLASALERARTGWAWRFFHGRDVHVEAEVSGALRPERIRHGVRKAIHRGAFVLFVVGDPHRARRVRAVLRAMDLGVDRAQVWTLPVGRFPATRTPGTNR